MLIFVTTQAGNTVIALDVEPEDTTESVKRKITDEVGIPLDQQWLTFEDQALKDVLLKYNFRNVRRNTLAESTDSVYARKTLTDEHTLKDYNIQGKTTLYLIPIPQMKKDSGGKLAGVHQSLEMISLLQQLEVIWLQQGASYFQKK